MSDDDEGPADQIDIRDNIVAGPVIGVQYNLHISAKEVAAPAKAIDKAARKNARVAVLAVVAALFLFSPPNQDSGDGGSGGPPSAKAPNGGQPAIVADVRKADPCSLLDAKALSGFGDTRIDVNYGEFDRCDVVISDHDSDHDVALVKLNFAGTPAILDSLTPTEKVGHVTVAKMRSDANACLRNLELADGNQVWIEATEIKSSALDMCALARAATEHAVMVLNQGPVPERPTPFPANSLAHSNACKLLDAGALSVIPGLDVHDSGYAHWECEWRSAAADATVDVSFSQDDDLTDDGRPVRLGGRQSYVTPKEYHDHNCVVRVEHRSYTDTAGETAIELAIVAVDGPQPSKELCATAKTLATAVAKRLPKP